MNQYTESNKTAQTKSSERFKIKSKYFGEYEPQLFIASRSKSKSRSTSKDDQNKFALKGIVLKTQTKATLQSKTSNNKQANSINPQILKPSARSYNASNLSEYLLNRAASPGRKKEGSAIQKIIYWVERKYNQKILNEKLEKGTSLSMIESRRVSNKNEEERFQEELKKIVYDLYIIKRLKGKKSYTPTSIPHDKSRPQTKKDHQQTIVHEPKVRTSYLKNLSSQYGVSKDIKRSHPKNDDKQALNNSKQHDIDNIASNQTSHSEKVEDFGIYRFKNAEMYSNGANQLFPISELSIEGGNRSAFKNSVQESNTPNKPYKNVEIPTMNSLQNLNAQSRTYQVLSPNLLETRLNKNFFTQTARSTSTNEILEISKNSIDENSFQYKQKNIANDFFLKGSPFSEKQLKKSFAMENGHEASDNIHNLAENKHESEASLTFQLNQSNNGSKILNSMGPELKSCSQLQLMQLKKKLKNETSLCDSDYWPFALFHPQKAIVALSSIEVNPLNRQTGQNDEILNQIFQMNDNQHRILKALNNKNSLNSDISNLQTSKIFNQNKQENNVENKTPQAFKLQQFNSQPLNRNIGVKSPRTEDPNAKIETKASNIIINGQKVQFNSKIKQNKKFAAQNYFSEHLQVKQSPIHKIQMIQTFEMPLNRTNDQKAAAEQNPSNPVRQSNVFTFNSLTSHNQQKPEIIRKKPQYKIPQQQEKNAFVKNCNIFGLCDMVSPKNDRNGQKEMVRSNHFTDNSTSGRDERSKSNQSKKSSKPKISFNYVSPNAKQPQIQNKQKKDEQNQSILLKSQSSHLRNSGQAPVKIQIKTSRQNKNTTAENKMLPVQKIPGLPVLSRQYNQIKEKTIKSETLIGDQKLRSYSVPHFVVQKAQDQANLRQQDDAIRRKFQTNNAFVNRGYETVQNYNSQRLLPVNTQNVFVQQKYQPIQSYYFQNPQSQNVKIRPIPSAFDGGRILKGKQPQFSPQKDHVYLFPISNSLQKEKRQRAQSLSNKNFITVKKNIP